MAVYAPFNAKRGDNQVLTATATSQSVTIDAVAKSVRILNGGLSVAHVRVGTGAQTATTADTPILGNSDLVISKGDGEDTLAYISAVGTTLHVQTGEGGI